MVEAAPGKPETSIRAASLLSYITGIGTLLSIGPGLAYNLYTGSSTGALLGMPPSFGDFLGSSPIGIAWGFAGVLVFGLILPLGRWVEHGGGVLVVEVAQERRQGRRSRGPGHQRLCDWFRAPSMVGHSSHHSGAVGPGVEDVAIEIPGVPRERTVRLAVALHRDRASGVIPAPRRP